MKTVSGFLILAAMLYINPQAQGQCPQGPDGSCVISFYISPARSRATSPRRVAHSSLVLA